MKAGKSKTGAKAPIIGLSKECLHLNSIYEMTRENTKEGGLLDLLKAELQKSYGKKQKKNPKVYKQKFDDFWQKPDKNDDEDYKAFAQKATKVYEAFGPGGYAHNLVADTVRFRLKNSSEDPTAA